MHVVIGDNKSVLIGVPKSFHRETDPVHIHLDWPLDIEEEGQETTGKLTACEKNIIGIAGQAIWKRRDDILMISEKCKEEYAVEYHGRHSGVDQEPGDRYL